MESDDPPLPSLTRVFHNCRVLLPDCVFHKIVRAILSNGSGVDGRILNGNKTKNQSAVITPRIRIGSNASSAWISFDIHRADRQPRIGPTGIEGVFLHLLAKAIEF